MTGYWAEIDCLQGYRFSADGRVQSRWKRGRGGLGHRWRDLRPTPNPTTGQVEIWLRVDVGISEKISLASLVLRAHCGPPPGPDWQARHIDRDPGNCRVDNLTWATPRELMEAARRYRYPTHAQDAQN